MDASFDRWRTGNYGADQFRGEDEWDSFVEKTCSDCLCENWCPTCEKFYDGDDDLYDHPCLIIKDLLEQKAQADHEMNLRMEEEYRG
jgi:hypothetical protein